MMGLLLLSGCTNLPLISQMFDQPTRESSSGEVFFDDFSETSSGWDRFQAEIGKTDYVKETYRIIVNEPNTDLFANPYQNFKDAVVEVKARRIGGPDNNSYGVICRYKDEQNFYAAQISSDGYGGIFRMKDGTYQLLGLESMLPVPAIMGGSADNLIRFECTGMSLTLFVNGEPVDYREDGSFETGDVGLIAGTFEEPGVQIAFDDFRVTLP